MPINSRKRRFVPEILPTHPGPSQYLDIEKKKFVAGMIKHGGNQTQAAHEVKKLTTSAARDYGSRMMKREDVRKEIAAALDKLEISHEFILDSRLKFVQAGLRQLNGQKRDNEPFVSPKDTDVHLQGIEKIVDKLERGAGNVGNSSISVTLSLHTKSVKDVMETRKQVGSWLDGIINGEEVSEEEVHLPQVETPNND